jgi:hypothetical protein
MRNKIINHEPELMVAKVPANSLNNRLLGQVERSLSARARQG